MLSATSLCVMYHMTSRRRGYKVVHFGTCVVSLHYLFLQPHLGGGMELSQRQIGTDRFTILCTSHQTISKQWTRKHPRLLST